MKQQSPVKVVKKRRDKENHNEEQLARDFFQTALGDTNCEELDKVQLQNAIAALSQKLLLFSNINEDKKATERHLQQSEDARVDLQKVLTETSAKTKQELGKMG
jgi:hypothetical protein